MRNDVAETDVWPESYLKAMPSARKVLEIGCRGAALGRAYKLVHPQAEWTAVGDMEALADAARHLDRTVVGDLDGYNFAGLGEAYDLIVFRDVIEWALEPELFLRAVRKLVDDGGRLVCCVSNANNLALLERILIGDLSYDRAGPFRNKAGRLFSAASIIKIFLDTGWSPNLISTGTGAPMGGTVEHLRLAADALGCSADAFNRNLTLAEMIFDCVPIVSNVQVCSDIRPTVSLIVPVTNQLQFDLNVQRSPALREMNAEVIPIHGASSAADGFERGRGSASGEWLIYCHQDIYFPRGSGLAILSELSKIPDHRKHDVIVGAIGLAEMTVERVARGGTQFSGSIIDRVLRLQYEATENAISIDESCVILHRDCSHKIDPSMGWHLWATDLVLSARRTSSLPPCKVVSVPIFHNSLTGWMFTEVFHKSVRRMFEKYPEEQTIISLCGTWVRPETINA